uniref:Uncharacterized protein n=1 Tax=Anopheles coluzzii TaxID=1518534 RepID=A0A8W7P6U1_ANOCL
MNCDGLQARRSEEWCAKHSEEIVSFVVPLLHRHVLARWSPTLEYHWRFGARLLTGGCGGLVGLWGTLGLGPTVGVRLLGVLLLLAVAVRRLNQILVDLAGWHGRPEEGAGLGAGKVYRDVQLLGQDGLQAELLLLEHQDGGIGGVALLQLGDQLRFQALVGGVVVVAVVIVDVADDRAALVNLGGPFFHSVLRFTPSSVSVSFCGRRVQEDPTGGNRNVMKIVHGPAEGKI